MTTLKYIGMVAFAAFLAASFYLIRSFNDKLAELEGDVRRATTRLDEMRKETDELKRLSDSTIQAKVLRIERELSEKNVGALLTYDGRPTERKIVRAHNIRQVVRHETGKYEVQFEKPFAKDANDNALYTALVSTTNGLAIVQNNTSESLMIQVIDSRDTSKYADASVFLVVYGGLQK